MEDVTPRFIDGVSIAAGITAVGQGTTGNEDNPAGEDVIDGSISADLEISALLFEYGEAFMLIEAGAGEGLQDDEIVSFWGVNDDAGDSNSRLEVTEAWYEHRFLDTRLIFTVGKVNLTNYFDGNEVANDETTQFLATGFVNTIAIEFPDNSPGARLTLSPNELLDFSIAWQDGDGDFEDILVLVQASALTSR
jgi:carbohydrate-selective porin OprB